MADPIETQARSALYSLESTVTSVQKLSSIAASLGPSDMEDFAYVSSYLGDQLQAEFQAFFHLISQQVLPLVADIKISSLASK